MTFAKKILGTLLFNFIAWIAHTLSLSVSCALLPQRVRHGPVPWLQESLEACRAHHFEFSRVPPEQMQRARPVERVRLSQLAPWLRISSPMGELVCPSGKRKTRQLWGTSRNIRA